MTRYTALLDACVLVPITLADTLLRVAERELYRPLWSERILAEAAYAVREVHADLPVEVVAKRFAAMRAAFEDAAVEGWEALEASLSLPDPDDRHVVAAALRGHADAIVTANLRDFPDEALAPLGWQPSIPTTSSSISWTSPRGSSSTSCASRRRTHAVLPSHRLTCSRASLGQVRLHSPTRPDG